MKNELINTTQGRKWTHDPYPLSYENSWTAGSFNWVHVTLTVLILTVCRMPVALELSKLTLPSMSSRSSVNRMPAWCLGGHGCNSCRELRFFLCSSLISCWSVQFSHFITELKIHHIFSFVTLMMTLTELILAICRTPVTYELSEMTLLSMSSRSSVNRAPAWCPDVRLGLRCLLGSMLVSCWSVHFLHFITKLKIYTILIHLPISGLSLSFDSPVAVIFTPEGSTTAKFTHNNNGPSSMLSHNRWLELHPWLFDRVTVPIHETHIIPLHSSDIAARWCLGWSVLELDQQVLLRSQHMHEFHLCLLQGLWDPSDQSPCNVIMAYLQTIHCYSYYLHTSICDALHLNLILIAR